MSKDSEIELTEKFRGVIFKTNYIVPSTVNDRGQKIFDFYANGGYSDYIKDKNKHEIKDEHIKEDAYKSNLEYLSEHYTKETDQNKEIPIWSKNDTKELKAHNNSIIFSSIISLDDITSRDYDLKKNAKRIFEYAFNQFTKSKGLDKQAWSYYGVYHNNTENHHLHLIFYQPKSVKDNKILDPDIKKNCFIPKKTFNKCIDYLQNDILLDISTWKKNAIFETKKELQYVFKKSLEQDVYLEPRKALANELANFNNGKGRLQFKQIVERSKMHETDIPLEIRQKPNYIPCYKYYNLKQHIDTVIGLVKTHKDVKSLNTQLENSWDGLKYKTKQLIKSQSPKTQIKQMAAVNSFINSQKKDLYLNLGNEVLQQAKSMVDFRTEHYKQERIVHKTFMRKSVPNTRSYANIEASVMDIIANKIGFGLKKSLNDLIRESKMQTLRIQRELEREKSLRQSQELELGI